MKFNSKAKVFVPDGTETAQAIARTTDLCIAAHQDDVELMCYPAIADCFGRSAKWFGAVVTADGAGSPRNGLYADYSDEQMKQIRVQEQNKAAFVGEYAFMAQLGYPSSQIKAADDREITDELSRIIAAAAPETLYMHNFADKHDTHVGVALKTLKAVRQLGKSERPRRLFGCEVWRSLDWVCDDEKIALDASGHPSVAAALVGVFDSQIAGGKRYDLAAQGRRTANATYYASHGCDEKSALSYAVDLTPLILDDSIAPEQFMLDFIDRFKADVAERLSRLS